MAQAVFVQDGECIDYTPVADVAAGDVVVQGDLIGVAKQPIAANTPGSLAVTGVFDFAKLAGLVLAVGALIYWDDAANVATNVSAGNKLLGKVVRAAAAADPTVRARLSP
jgi:predicted RecA/RadA family phage recombinase